MTVQKLDLGLTAVGSAGGCCGGDAYTCDIPDYAAGSVITELDVDGMTCEHCVSAVTKELTSLDGVEEVSIALKAGGTSRVVVRGAKAIAADDARRAIEAAGYTLAG